MESHPEHHQATEEFHQWLRSGDARLPGLKGPNNDVECDFIPESALQAYFTSSRVEELLDAVIDPMERSTADETDVRDHYSQCFAILLAIGHGYMIRDFVTRDSLSDRKLPFLTKPDNFPHSPDIFEDFKRAQWSFCAPKLHSGAPRDLPEDAILPIVHKQEIGEGGSATIYKIVVAEEYNELLPKGLSIPDRRRLYKNTFVLKAFHPGEAEQHYNAERKAFKQLQYAKKSSPHIVSCYGGFVRGNSYNLILEYADQGTLEEFMRKNPQPPTIEETMLFWDRLFDLTHGLNVIHGTRRDPGAKPQRLLGYHQDINPHNILVFSGSGKSRYDCYFKIADLGVAHFKSSFSGIDDDHDLDSHGTRAFGAPETFRADGTLDDVPLRVGPQADIWSIGCVWSEAVVWNCDGWKRVLEFRRRRQEEIGEKGGDVGDYLFHHDSAVLDVVLQTHSRIIERHHAKDKLCAEVLEHLVDNMLQHQNVRLDALQVYDRSKRSVKKFERIYGVSVNSLADNWGESPHEGYQHQSPPRTPPQIPPEEVGSSPTIKRFSTFHESAVQEHQNGTLAKSQVSPHSSNNPEANHTGSRRKDPRDTESQVVEDFEGALPRSKTSLRQGHGPSYRPSSRSPYASSPYSTNPSRASREIGSSHSPSPSGAPATTLPSRISIQDELTATSTALYQESQDPASELQSHPQGSFTGRRDGWKPHPEMTVTRGLNVKRQRERSRNVDFPNEQLTETLRILKDRDHAFLIDNGKSMAEHSTNVSEVVELLAYMVNDADPDGMDLHFSANTTTKIKAKTPVQMLKELDRCQYVQEWPDFRSRFAKILSDYQIKFGRTQYWDKVKHWRATPSKGPRKLSLYVLTDGVWQPETDLVQEIKNLVQRLKEHGLGDKQIGIHFIRFGNDSTGISRLRKLDCGLELDLDIIDTTPANGNVWKMLLGAINNWFDDDDKEVEDKPMLRAQTQPVDGLTFNSH